MCVCVSASDLLIGGSHTLPEESSKRFLFRRMSVTSHEELTEEVDLKSGESLQQSANAANVTIYQREQITRPNMFRRRVMTRPP